ncbi:hypothetical protein EYF80_058479 [Liparis tanakae]|uniref:Uncharacterized protein n=1 Tax=Liparis tanakae TaxID=230148 RepID=A0A4Z2ERF6_9TELE|nr:hypothetical protein EYF80_058479 [Liparis tanakae]
MRRIPERRADPPEEKSSAAAVKLERLAERDFRARNKEYDFHFPSRCGAVAADQNLVTSTVGLGRVTDGLHTVLRTRTTCKRTRARTPATAAQNRPVAPNPAE